MSGPPAGTPDFEAPGFVACANHPQQMTGIRCQRCGRPICGACMTEASVGFHCPRCATSGRKSVRAPRTRFGALAGTSGGTVTKVLMGVVAGVWVLNLITLGLVDGLLVLRNPSVEAGQFWRLLTYAITSGGLFGMLMNLLVLWIAGRAIEAELGGWRFLALYFASGLGGATLFFLLAPPYPAVGASTAVIGLLAANAIGKSKTGEDIRGDISLLILLVLYAVLVGFQTFGWIGFIGGIAVGAISGVILAYAPRQNRILIQTVGLLAVVAVCLAAVVAKIVLT